MWSGKVRNFIIRERLYVWLLIFIISINIALFLSAQPFPTAKKLSEVRKGWVKKEPKTKEDLIRLIQKNKTLGVVISFFSLAVLFAILAGFFLDFIIFILKKEKAVLIFPTILHKDPKWEFWDVCRVGILFLWFGYMLVFIESALSGVFPIIKTDDNLRSVLNATITDILALVFIIYFVVYEYREKIVSLGLSLKNFLKNFFYGLAGYLAAVPVLIIILIFIIWISSLLKYEPPMQPVLEIFLEEKKRALVIYLSIFVSIFGPIVEETFFRGFMYKAVKKKLGFKAALLSTSALFALLHANLAGFLPIMILGMLLAYLFEKTGTLVAPCAVHILHNSVMVGFTFLMKAVLQ